MIVQNKAVLILMTTYNGSKYIKEQIESIINQSYTKWKLIIRDDGSSDGTREILQEFESNEGRITVIDNSSDKHGAYLNFWTLINYAKALSRYDYYFFADQDDVWLPKKIERMIDFDMRQENRENARLIYADMQIIDGKGEIVYPSIDEVMGIGEISGLSLFYTHGYLWGCDTMINMRLFDLVPALSTNNPNIAIMSHDNYYGKFALLFGEIKYFREICIKHRRYGGNTTGSYQIKMTLASALTQVIINWNDLLRTHAKVYTQTLITLSQMEKMDFLSREMMEIRKSIDYGGTTGVLILAKYKVKRKQVVRTLGIYLIMFLKMYRKYIIL